MAIRPLTLALMQQNMYTGKYRPSNSTHTVVKRQTFSSSIQLTLQYLVRSTWSNSRLKTVKLDVSTTELGNAFQISQIRFVKK